MDELMHHIFLWLRRALIVVPMLAPLAASRAAQADDWLDRRYPYVVLDQDVHAALQEFSYQLNQPVKISDRVQGSLKGAGKTGNARAFLDQVAAAAHAGWYYDGSVIVVRAASEMVLRRFDAAKLGEQRRERLLRDSQPTGRQVSLSYNAESGEIAAYGPAEFVETIAQRMQPPAPAHVAHARTAPARGMQVYRFHAGG
jgi:type II secretory pathway component GspD/PulD (secretin)